MSRRSTAARVIGAGIALGAGAYAAYAAVAWLRYGHPTRASRAARDPILDHLFPRHDVVERHAIRVRAPASVTLDTACDMDIMGTPVARAIFRARALILGAGRDDTPRSRGFVADMQALGWGLLAEVPGREIVMGGVTQPWHPNPVFRALTPEAFIAFDEPDFVKIAFTLRADPLDTHRSVFRTETRAVATDAAARATFRRYWALLSPGIILIRRSMLRPLAREAERRSGTPQNG